MQQERTRTQKGVHSAHPPEKWFSCAWICIYEHNSHGERTHMCMYMHHREGVVASPSAYAPGVVGTKCVKLLAHDSRLQDCSVRAEFIQSVIMAA